MTIPYEEQRQKEGRQSLGSQPQKSGHQHLHRQVRRKAENATGEGGTVGTRTCKRDRNSIPDTLQVGIWGSLSRERADTSCCRSTKNQGCSSCRRQKVKNLEKFSIFPALEFLASKRFSERIFKNFPQTAIFPIDISPFVEYNTNCDAHRTTEPANARPCRRASHLATGCGFFYEPNHKP